MPPLGDAITNQYADHDGVPEGPTFMAPTEFGFPSSWYECGPGVLTSDAAHSGSNSLHVGCDGGEFGGNGTTDFAMGYTTDAISFWVGFGYHVTSNEFIITTAFDANRNVLEQVVTTFDPSSPLWQQASLSTTSDNIAFVSVEEGQPGGDSPSRVAASRGEFFLDDLTYDAPSSPPPATFALGSRSTVYGVSTGSQVTVPLTVAWVNNPNSSASPVSLTATGPPGITTSFSANPTSSGGSTMTVDVPPTAPLGETSITVTGYVDQGLASQQSSTLTITLNVLSLLTIGAPGPIAVAPCTTVQVELQVVAPSWVTGPVTISVNTGSQPGVTISGLSSSDGQGTIIHPYAASVRATPNGGVASATLDLVGPPSYQANVAEPLVVQAAYPGYTPAFDDSGSITIAPETISDVLANGAPATSVHTAALDQPGTTVTLQGAGFCPGTLATVGDPANPPSATPTSVSVDGTSLAFSTPGDAAVSVSADGRTLTFNTPANAVSGKLILTSPSGVMIVGPDLTVDTFRDTRGFSWTNADYVPGTQGYNAPPSGVPPVTANLTQQMEDDLFGQGQTNINVAGWLVRKPEAYELQTLTNNAIADGACFGMAYSSLEFFDDPAELSAFTTGGADDPWHIGGGATYPDQSIMNYVVERFSLQFTDQLIPDAVNAAIGIHGTNDDLNAIESSLAAGQPVILGMSHWDGLSLSGHAVLAYNTQPLPDGAVAVDVLNSNEPYSPSEISNPSGLNGQNGHAQDEFTESQLIIKDGNWTFPEGKDFGSNGQAWGGSEADLVVYPHSDLPLINGQQPALPNLFTATAAVIFGSANDGVTQLVGSHGGELFDHGRVGPERSWPQGVAPLTNFDGATRPLQEVALRPGETATLTASVKRGAGGGGMEMMLPGLEATLAARVHKDQSDEVGVDPHADSISYEAGAPNTSLSGSLLSTPISGAGAAAARDSELSDRTASFSTSLAKDAQDTLAFPHGRQLTLTHSGVAAQLSLTLSSFEPDGQPVGVALPELRLGTGERLAVSPENWSALASTPIRLTITVRGRTTTETVRARAIGKAFATVTGATIKTVRGGKAALALRLRVTHAAANASLSIIATVRNGKQVVRHTAPNRLLTTALSRGTATLSLGRRLAPGRYRLEIKLLEVTPQGMTQGSALITSRKAIVVR